MIKQILYFGSPAKISTELKQIVIERKNNEGNFEKITRPIEDIGVVVLDHPQISITHLCIAQLIQNNVVIISCNQNYMPHGIMLPIEGHDTQSERIRSQIEASEPLKKNLWQQTIIAKIKNQAAVLEYFQKDAGVMYGYAKEVKSGDADNKESTAANYYWRHLFSEHPDFSRHPKGPWPNAVLNYGYAILRSVTARSLVASGLFPSFGIFHRNRYNAFALADDIMEPYRPYVDIIAKHIYQKYPEEQELTKEIKAELLKIPHIDTTIENEKSPLMIALQRTSSSLVKCFMGQQRKLIYPEIKFK